MGDRSIVECQEVPVIDVNSSHFETQTIPGHLQTDHSVRPRKSSYHATHMALGKSAYSLQRAIFFQTLLFVVIV